MEALFVAWGAIAVIAIVLIITLMVETPGHK